MKVVIELSTRELARLAGVSQSTLMRILKNSNVVQLRFTCGSDVVHLKNATVLETDNCDPNMVHSRFACGSDVVQQEENTTLPLTSPTLPKEEIPPIEEKNIINNIQKETPPKNQAKRVDDLSQYEWVDSRIKEVLDEWIEHKRKSKQTYKTEIGLKKLHNQLLRWSKGDPSMARKIVERSMMNNWAGLYEPKEGDFKTDDVGVVLTEQPKTIEDYGFDW